MQANKGNIWTKKENLLFLQPSRCQKGNRLPHFVVQPHTSPAESFAARMYGDSAQVVPIKGLPNLPQSGWIPVGSVEFCLAAMRHQGILPPGLSTYPDSLRDFLRREVWQATAGQVRMLDQAVFVKPLEPKRFTGFVWPYGGLDQAEFASFPDDYPVWCSTVMEWQSEWRVYVVNHQIVGQARYDDGEEFAPKPDQEVIQAMVRAYQREAPAGYGLDVGVNEKGETALVEVNDGWALGLYKGMPAKEYLELLRVRWEELEKTKKEIT